jgi:hypothetical protein
LEQSRNNRFVPDILFFPDSFTNRVTFPGLPPHGKSAGMNNGFGPNTMRRAGKRPKHREEWIMLRKMAISALAVLGLGAVYFSTALANPPKGGAHTRPPAAHPPTPGNSAGHMPGLRPPAEVSSIRPPKVGPVTPGKVPGGRPPGATKPSKPPKPGKLPVVAKPPMPTPGKNPNGPKPPKPNGKALPNINGTLVVNIKKQTVPYIVNDGGVVMPSNGGFDSGVAGGDSTGSALPWQTKKHLHVTNSTNESVRFFLLYVDEDQAGETVWSGAQGDGSNEPLCFRLDPGETVRLGDGERTILTSQIRFWVESKSVNWDDYKDEDLVLVDEPYQADSPVAQVIRIAKE